MGLRDICQSSSEIFICEVKLQVNRESFYAVGTKFGNNVRRGRNIYAPVRDECQKQAKRHRLVVERWTWRVAHLKRSRAGASSCHWSTRRGQDEVSRAINFRRRIGRVEFQDVLTNHISSGSDYKTCFTVLDKGFGLRSDNPSRDIFKLIRIEVVSGKRAHTRGALLGSKSVFSHYANFQEECTRCFMGPFNRIGLNFKGTLH